MAEKEKKEVVQLTVDEKVEALRKQLKRFSLAAWIINGTDPHESEYVSERWQSRKWISGFTGSYGTVIVSKDRAVIWVDSRYFVQCAQQIQGTCFEMRKLDGLEASSPMDYLKENFKKNQKIGISAETLMVSQERDYRENGINITPMEDILDKIWKDRPAMPEFPVVKLTKKLCGESPESKIERIRAKAAENGADYCLISSLDDIAWILNLRGNDILHTPVFLAYLLIGPKRVSLFTPKERFARINLEKECYTLYGYDEITSELAKLKFGTVYLNPQRINMKLYGALDLESVKVKEGREFSTDFKAAKNEAELEGMRIAHILDGVALVNFLSDVKSGKKRYTEVSIAQALASERELEEDYLEPSFNTIAGFGPHGALCHYSATEETDVPIKGSGLLVLDSGGQYTCGTTDVTRTILFGRATKEQKEDYTLVLKGHLALAAQVFPKGTNGLQLDVLARQFLWNSGQTFFHGTGHGVGFRLGVHEGPQRISTTKACADVPLVPGMVISDEPGIYKEGRHGVRIENLVAVTEAMETEFGQFYTFEVLTCCPYERDLIVKKMLTEDETDLVNTYHAWVYSMLKDLVDERALPYLKEATKPL